MSLVRTAISGTIWLTLGQYASSAVAILGNIWLARILGPEPFGVFFVVSSLAEILFLLGSFSFAQYVVQAPVVTYGHWRAVVLLSLALALLLVLIAGVVVWVLRDQYPMRLLAFFFLLSICRAIWSISLVFTYTLDRVMAYRSLAASRFTAALAGTAISLIIAYGGGDIWSFFGRECGMVMVGTLTTWAAARRVSILSCEVSERSPYREVWNFGFRLSGVQILEQAFHRIDGVLLGRMLGLDRSADLGYYAQAKYLANIPNVAVDSGTRAVAYRVFAVVREDLDRLQRSFGVIQFWAVRAIAPISLIFFTFPEDTLHWTLGPQWISAGPLLQSLSCVALFLVLFNNIKMFRLVLQDWKGLYWAYGTQLLVYLLAMAIGVNAWGVVGGAVAYSVANLAGLIAMYWRRDAFPKALFQVRNIGYPLIAAAVAATCANLTIGPSSTVWGWLGSVVYVLIVYVLVWCGLEGRLLLQSLREIRGLLRANANTMKTGN